MITGNFQREDPPGGYQEVLYWRIGDRRAQVVMVNLLAVLLLGPALLLFWWLGVTAGRMPETGQIDLLQLALVLAAGFLTIVLHELLHGVAMMAFGGQTRYGVMLKQLMVYATAPGHAFKRSAYLVIGLAPLVCISLAAILGMVVLAGTPWVGLLAVCGAGNAAAAAGDLVIVSIVLRYPATARLIDERDGVRILLPN